VRIRYVIATGGGSHLAGMVIPVAGDTLVPHTVEANGAALDPEDYPNLYAAVGLSYNPERIRRDDWVGRLARRFRVFLTVPNPHHIPGKFKVPDLRGDFVRGL